MSNELSIPNKLPAYLQDYESETNDSLISGGEVLPRISLRGRQFRFKKDGTERSLDLGVPLTVVILGASPVKGFSKAYFIDPYVEGSDDPPDCSSTDGIEPDSWVSAPECSNCASCPHNVFGSGTNSNGEPTRGKACADIKRLLVLPPDKPESEIFILQVPPASLKVLSSFGRDLASHKIPIEGIVTKLSFADAEYPKLEFQFSAFIDEGKAPAFLARAKSDEVRDIMMKVLEEDKSLTDAVDPKENLKPSAEEKEPSTKVGVSELLQLPDGSYATDGAGNNFDVTQHARKEGEMGGQLKNDKTFIKKRNAGKVTPEKKPEPENVDGFGVGSDAGESENPDPDAGASDATEGGDDDAEAKLNDILDSWAT